MIETLYGILKGQKKNPLQIWKAVLSCLLSVPCRCGDTRLLGELDAVWVTPAPSALPQLNILACGVVGSYSVVLAVNSYLFTSLSYITLNVLRRALNTDFRGAIMRAPLQTNGKTQVK